MSGAPTRSGDVRRRRTRVHPILEVLERRQVLSTFHVNTLLDTLAVNLQTGGDASGHISLRSAIMAANSSVGADTITVPAGAIILSSLAWTALHLQYDWFFFGEVFSVGLWFGYIRYRSGSTWLTIVLHALNNMTAVVLTMWLGS